MQSFTAFLQVLMATLSCSCDVSSMILFSVPGEAFSIIAPAHEMLDFSLDSRIGAIKAVLLVIRLHCHKKVKFDGKNLLSTGISFFIDRSCNLFKVVVAICEVLCLRVALHTLTSIL